VHTSSPLSDGGRAESAGLARRIRVPRSIGLGLGAVCVGAALYQRGAPPWLWVLLALNGFVWPQVAYWWSSRSARSQTAERRNIVLDAAFGGFWLPAMGFNLLPSTLIATMLVMDTLAVGGARLFVRGLGALLCGAGAGVLLLGAPVTLAASLPTVVAALPFLVLYPLTIGLVTYRLSRRLSRQKQELAASELLHRATIDAIEAGIVLYDANDRLVLCNRMFRELYGDLAPLLQPGRRFEEMLRGALACGLIPEAAGREEAWLRERVERHARPQGPMLRELPGDRWHRIVEQRLPDGGLLSFSADVTELVRKERALEDVRREAQQARERLEDAIDVLPDGFALYDAQDRLLMCNQHYRTMYAETGDAIEEGLTFEELLRAGLARGQYPSAAGHEEEWLARRLEQHRHPQGALLQDLPGNRWLRINERRTREGGLAGVRTDVTDLVRREQELQRLNRERAAYEERLREANAQLERLSDTDALTGLANRRRFDRRLHDEWRRARRSGKPLALLMVDVDFFKRYNDRYGHLEGDECLRRVSAALARCARRPADLAARYGGEEFVLLLPETTLEEGAHVARSCLEAIDAEAVPHEDSAVARHVTASIGIAACRADQSGRDPTELVRAADAALYRAKEGGRHRCVADDAPAAQTELKST